MRDDEEKEEEEWFPPMQSPSFRNTHSVHSDKTHTRPNLFYCSLLHSFLFPLSLSLSVGVPRCLLFSPYLPLSLFSSLTPPLFPAIGGLVVSLFFLKGQLDFRRQAH